MQCIDSILVWSEWKKTTPIKDIRAFGRNLSKDEKNVIREYYLKCDVMLENVLILISVI